jgi:hypothetical protein
VKKKSAAVQDFEQRKKMTNRTLHIVFDFLPTSKLFSRTFYRRQTGGSVQPGSKWVLPPTLGRRQPPLKNISETENAGKNHMLSTRNFYQNVFGTTELLIRKTICQKCSLIIH